MQWKVSLHRWKMTSHRAIFLAMGAEGQKSLVLAGMSVGGGPRNRVPADLCVSFVDVCVCVCVPFVCRAHEEQKTNPLELE